MRVLGETSNGATSLKMFAAGSSAALLKRQQMRSFRFFVVAHGNTIAHGELSRTSRVRSDFHFILFSPKKIRMCLFPTTLQNPNSCAEERRNNSERSLVWKSFLSRPAASLEVLEQHVTQQSAFEESLSPSFAHTAVAALRTKGAKGPKRACTRYNQ